MTKFTRKFNTKLKRIERWHTITAMLCEFEGVINNHDSASPEEIQIMKSIHRKLYECCVMAKGHLKRVSIV